MTSPLQAEKITHNEKQKQEMNLKSSLRVEVGRQYLQKRKNKIYY